MNQPGRFRRCSGGNVLAVSNHHRDAIEKQLPRDATAIDARAKDEHGAQRILRVVSHASLSSRAVHARRQPRTRYSMLVAENVDSRPVSDLQFAFCNLQCFFVRSTSERAQWPKNTPLSGTKAPDWTSTTSSS